MTSSKSIGMPLELKDHAPGRSARRESPGSWTSSRKPPMEHASEGASFPSAVRRLAALRPRLRTRARGPGAGEIALHGRREEEYVA